MHECGVEPVIMVGCDFREYSVALKNALIIGLIHSGIRVRDIGTVLSPMAYYSRIHFHTSAVAMVTASHNPNGWTGIKTGFANPLTHGPAEMDRFREIVFDGHSKTMSGGGYERVYGLEPAYIEDLCGKFRVKRTIRAVCATGNGTASRFAPKILERVGVETVPLNMTADFTFPHYNPNPESMEMLNDMASKVRESKADIALGFDGDGDRLGVIDDEGEEIFSDKIGVLIARDLARNHPGARFVIDVKSTGLFATDPILKECGSTSEYWKTGHSHLKSRIFESGALAGFEKSGHYFFSNPIGHGYDCGLTAAVELIKLLDRNPEMRLSDLKRTLPRTWATPTMSPYCADEEKYETMERISSRLQQILARGGALGGRKIASILTVNGARVILENGSWGLVRASSNTPNLVVVCESVRSPEEMRAIFRDLDTVIRVEPNIGEYDQKI